MENNWYIFNSAFSSKVYTNICITSIKSSFLFQHEVWNGDTWALWKVGHETLSKCVCNSNKDNHFPILFYEFNMDKLFFDLWIYISIACWSIHNQDISLEYVSMSSCAEVNYGCFCGGIDFLFARRGNVLRCIKKRKRQSQLIMKYR